MDNASKNAGDMIGSLTLQYNRGRQAAITNELVDIITGAFLVCTLINALIVLSQVLALCNWRCGGSGRGGGGADVIICIESLLLVCPRTKIQAIIFFPLLVFDKDYAAFTENHRKLFKIQSQEKLCLYESKYDCIWRTCLRRVGKERAYPT